MAIMPLCAIARLLWREGISCALLGRNGAGKTTLLRILAGLTHFQRGAVTLFGEKPRAENARLHSGFLGHGIGVYEDLSARENLALFCQHQREGCAGASLDRYLARTSRLGARGYHASAPVFARDAATTGVGARFYSLAQDSAVGRAIHFAG